MQEYENMFISIYYNKDDEWINTNDIFKRTTILEKGIELNYVLDTSLDTLVFTYINKDDKSLKQFTRLKIEIYETYTSEQPLKTDYFYVIGDEAKLMNPVGYYRHHVKAFEPFGRLTFITTDAMRITQPNNFEAVDRPIGQYPEGVFTELGEYTIYGVLLKIMYPIIAGTESMAIGDIISSELELLTKDIVSPEFNFARSNLAEILWEVFNFMQITPCLTMNDNGKEILSYKEYAVAENEIYLSNRKVVFDSSKTDTSNYGETLEAYIDDAVTASVWRGWVENENPSVDDTISTGDRMYFRFPYPIKNIESLSVNINNAWVTIEWNPDEPGQPSNNETFPFHFSELSINILEKNTWNLLDTEMRDITAYYEAETTDVRNIYNSLQPSVDRFRREIGDIALIQLVKDSNPGHGIPDTIGAAPRITSISITNNTDSITLNHAIYSPSAPLRYQIEKRTRNNELNTILPHPVSSSEIDINQVASQLSAKVDRLNSNEKMITEIANSFAILVKVGDKATFEGQTYYITNVSYIFNFPQIYGTYILSQGDYRISPSSYKAYNPRRLQISREKILRQINLRSYLELSFATSAPLPPSGVSEGFLNIMLLAFTNRNVNITNNVDWWHSKAVGGLPGQETRFPLIKVISDEGLTVSFTAIDEVTSSLKRNAEGKLEEDFYTIDAYIYDTRVPTGFIYVLSHSIPYLMQEKLSYIYKDPSEVLSMTFQLLNVIHPNHVDEIFFRLTPLLNQNPLKIYICNEFYTKEDTVVKSVIRTLDTGISYSTSLKYIEIPASYNTDKSWAIGDIDGNLILAVNQLDPNNRKNRVYFKTTDNRTLAD